jgi:hypothetical protein
MWFIRMFQIQQGSGGRPGHHSATHSPVPALQRHNGRRIMRQMLVAATIAASLLALWAALLPLAA